MNLPRIFVALSALLTLSLSGCYSLANNQFNSSNSITVTAQIAPGGYQSMFAELYPETLPSSVSGIASSLSARSRGTGILRDFHSAAASTNVTEAEQRWLQFRRNYRLPSGEFETEPQQAFASGATKKLLV